MSGAITNTQGGCLGHVEWPERIQLDPTQPSSLKQAHLYGCLRGTVVTGYERVGHQNKEEKGTSHSIADWKGDHSFSYWHLRLIHQ